MLGGVGCQHALDQPPEGRQFCIKFAKEGPEHLPGMKTRPVPDDNQFAGLIFCASKLRRKSIVLSLLAAAQARR